MKDRKIISVLKLLDPQSCKRLKKFLASPYFNASPKLRDLCAFYLKYYPDFTDDSLTEEAAFKVLKTGKEFSLHELNRFSSKLFKLIETFLTVEQLDKSLYSSPLMLLDKYAELKAPDHFQQQQKKIDKWLAGPQINYSDRVFYTFLKSKISFNFSLGTLSQITKKAPITEWTNTLDQYYMIEILQAGAWMGYQNPQRQPEVLIPLLPTVKALISKNISSYPTIIQSWYYINLLLQEPGNAEIYQALKNIFLNQLTSITPLDARNLLVALRAAIPAQFPGDRQKIFEAYFELYDLESRYNLEPTDIYLPLKQFSNAITIALYLNKLDWAKEYIEKNKGFLPEPKRNDLLNFNFARIAFRQGDYSQVLKFLVSVNFKEDQFNLAVKRLYLKTYYMLNDVDSFEHALNSLRVFNFRSDANDQQQKIDHNQFSAIVNGLFKYRLKPEGKDVPESFLKEILANQKLPEHDWLIEICEAQLK